MKKIRQLHKTELRIVNSSIDSTERSRRKKREEELDACTWRAPLSVLRSLPFGLVSNWWFRHISICQHAHLQNWDHTQGHHMWPHRRPLPDSRDATKARPCAQMHTRTHGWFVPIAGPDGTAHAALCFSRSHLTCQSDFSAIQCLQTTILILVKKQYYKWTPISPFSLQ